MTTTRPRDRLIRVAAPRGRRPGVALLALLLGAAACDLDLENPNAPTETEVLTDINGVIAVGVGIQQIYAQAIEDYLVPNSLITDEWGTGTRSLISYQSLLTGQSFDPGFAVVEAPWSNSYRVIRAANTLLGGVDNVGLAAGFRSGMRATAKLFRAMAFGQLYLNYLQAPIDIGADAPVPRPRAEVLDTVLALLESARGDLQGVSEADLAGLRSRVLGSQFDLRNTIDAMLARYYLLDGQHQRAIEAAERVNLGVLSQLSYPAPTRNPIENLSVQAGYVFPLKSFVDQAQPGDRRPAYWVNTAATPFRGNPDSTLLPHRKYEGSNDSYPVYLPDEMRLIRAEAHTRLGQLGQAATLVNAVRTQASSALDEPVAGLPPLPPEALDTEAELLAAIAYERRYELYLQGLRWEDARRLAPAVVIPKWRDFLPLPRQECLTNPSIPAGACE